MHLNIIRTKAVNELLKDLGQDFVFVGGAVVSLYASQSTAESQTRATDDVDIIVELATYGGYSKLDARLREIGFSNDMFSGVICRYAIGFSNKWYQEGFRTAIDHRIDRDTVVKIFTLPYFVASKLEAFKSRGENDFIASTDFQDLVYILEHTDNFEEKMRLAPDHLKSYLKDEFSRMLESEDIGEGISAHMADGYHAPVSDGIIHMLRETFDIDPPYLGYSR